MNIYQWLKRAKKLYSRPSLVLMYHRVADINIDPWGLSVSPQNFEQQMQVLKQTGLVAPVSHLIPQLNPKNVKKTCIIITFDDGYSDNYLVAKPLLEKYDLPATFFICTKHISEQKEFWWDELAYILLDIQNLPRKLSLDLKGDLFPFDLYEEAALTGVIKQKIGIWDAYQEPTTLRAQLYLKLWQLLSPLTYQEQQNVLADLWNWTGIPKQPRASYFSMTKDQLNEFANNNLFTIGAHTVSHPALAYHSENIQHREIAQCKQFLESLTNDDINSFAYPSGNFNKLTMDVLKQQGFQVAFTTQHMLVNKQTDPFQIGRFKVNNWTGREFEDILTEWL